MKIRIKGNSVRIRLSKTEVERLSSGAALEESTNFGDSRFGYAVQPVHGGDRLTARFEKGIITMHVPESLLKNWAANSVVGFESDMTVNGSEHLHLLLEKDFKCADQPAEEQSDYYDNPEKNC